ncbi:MAG TPA: multiubiquitin domain-containing protein [Polyangiaceae bacterium]|jgi:hypothetical protein
MSEHPKLYKFFLDAKEFETPDLNRTGAQIKAFIPSIPAVYQLYLEEEGDTPDKPISDSETISLEGKIKHFYAVPPATFGK